MATINDETRLHGRLYRRIGLKHNTSNARYERSGTLCTPAACGFASNVGTKPAIYLFFGVECASDEFIFYSITSSTEMQYAFVVATLFRLYLHEARCMAKVM